jgi:hypothetical protein
MTWFDALAFTPITLVLIAALYSVRSLRKIGSKLTAYQVENRSASKKILGQLHEINSSLQVVNLLTLNSGSNASSRDWSYVLSFTSHPARFAALPELLPSLASQLLQPIEIHFNVAKDEADQLSPELRTKLDRAGISIFEVDNLGPGKKLIPTLKRTNLPVICIDDDLILEPDLTLQLLIQHHLYPHSVIASRTHRVTVEKTGMPKTFEQWDKQWADGSGPAEDLMATSGAGTLFTKELLHEDALNEKLYSELSLHTDDLWWYFQARRIGVNVRRIPGARELNFIPETQEVGLWRTGNKDRNELNLMKLIDKYGKPF